MWQDDLKHNITTADEIAGRLQLGPEEARVIRDVCKTYPASITEYYFSLIDPHDPDDPIRRLVIPQEGELALGGEVFSGGEDVNTKIRGLQHKYATTALLLTSDTCASYCRFCFRKRFVGMSDSEAQRQLDDACDYIRQHPEIHNVILSGGDGLMNSNEVLRRNLGLLCQLPQLDFIRIATRVPVVFPQRIFEDRELLDVLAEAGNHLQLYVVTHFNHPRELTEEAHRAIRDLREAGTILRNQTVLLKGVNDDADTLRELMRGLTRWGVTPYYLFQCRPVRGVESIFQVPLQEGQEMVEQAKGKLSGIAKQFRYCMSHSTGKIEVLGSLGGEEMVFKYHRAKEEGDVGRLFTAPVAPDQTWLTLKGMV